MKRMLVVIAVTCLAAVATTPPVRAAQDERERRAPAPERAAPAPVAVPRAEPPARPSPAFSGRERAMRQISGERERAQVRSMPRETPAPRALPRAESVRPPSLPPARVTSPVFATPAGAAPGETLAQRTGQRSAPRGSGSGARAVPRGGGTSGAGRGQTASAPRGERRAAPSGGSGGQVAVPRGDRPRDGRYPVGQAAARTGAPYGGGYYPRYWYYPGSAYYYYPPAFGLGYFYYDPFWWGYAGYGGYPYGGYYGGYYGSAAYYGGSYGIGVGYASGGGGGSGGYYGSGHLRLKVKPRDAEVYVDGYFMGLVDDFDGMFQKLQLDSGPHRVEVRKPGFTTLMVEVRVPIDETVTFRGEMRPLP